MGGIVAEIGKGRKVDGIAKSDDTARGGFVERKFCIAFSFYGPPNLSARGRKSSINLKLRTV